MTNVSKVACIIIYLIKKNLNKLFVIIPPKNKNNNNNTVHIH
jgi:hypothetical protein